MENEKKLGDMRPSKGCLFQNGYDSRYCWCDFIGQTNMARQLICPPGEGCTMRATTQLERCRKIAKAKAMRGWRKEHETD